MDPGLLRDVLTLGLGLVTGVMSAAFGVGGAVISTPGLRLLGAPALVAVGSTLPAILPGAVAGTLRYWREGLVDRRVVALAVPAGMAGAVAGALATEAVPGEGHWLMVATALVVGMTAGRLAASPRPRPRGAEATEQRPPAAAAVGIGLVAGLFSGLLGVGGGTILVPAFLTLLRLPLKETIATSLACVGILAVPAAATHAYLGHIDWRFALLLAATVVPGARIGAGLTIRSGEHRLRVAVAAVLGVIAIAYLATELPLALR